jgi:LCP family protein required for cell wall assembly
MRKGRVVAARTGGTDPAGPVPAGTPAAAATGRRIPRWAWLCTVLGAVLMVLSGTTLIASEALLARYAGAVETADLFGEAAPARARSDIKGPLTILLVGIDPRTTAEPPRSDSILIMHVPAGLDRAYLFSIPRDTVVDIPRFDKAGYPGGRGKINGAMTAGSRTPGGAKPNIARGFELLSKTLTRYTGIERFDAGAIINFSGFLKIVDAMGGVTVTFDRDFVSEHRRPDGTHREHNPRGEGYIGPQAKYRKGTAHLEGWQALDFVRQRKTVGGDYVRQQNQQKFVKAMAKQALSKDVATNPIKLDRVLRAAGQSLIFNGRGHTVVDYGVALRNLGSESIIMVKLPGAGIGTRGNYVGEELLPVAHDFFAAVRAGSVDEFILAHPELVSS